MDAKWSESSTKLDETTWFGAHWTDPKLTGVSKTTFEQHFGAEMLLFCNKFEVKCADIRNFETLANTTASESWASVEFGRVQGTDNNDLGANPIFAYLLNLWRSTLSQSFSEWQSSIPILVFMLTKI